jgi:hypothetical protein
MSELLTIQFALTEALYTNPTVIDRGQALLLELWGRTDTPENRAWVWSGWDSHYRVAASPAVTVYVYRATALQMKQELLNTLTPAEMQRYKDWFQQEPQAKCSMNRTPDDSLAVWGVEPKPVGEE